MISPCQYILKCWDSENLNFQKKNMKRSEIGYHHRFFIFSSFKMIHPSKSLNTCTSEGQLLEKSIAYKKIYFV